MVDCFDREVRYKHLYDVLYNVHFLRSNGCGVVDGTLQASA